MADRLFPADNRCRYAPARLGRAGFCLRQRRRICGSSFLRRGRHCPHARGRRLSRRGARPAELENANDFKRFGRPNYGFLVSSGVIDSMVNHYTAAKRRRSSDVYTPGGKAAKRPDRAVNVYCRLIREASRRYSIAIGGVEASLRRFAHYDYWDDAVRPSILVDSGADLLMFGMGERTILVTADWMSRGAPVWECAKMRGVCFLSPAAMRASVEIPSYEDCVRSKKKIRRGVLVQYNEQDPIRGHAISQRHGDQYVVQTVPDMPPPREELDQSYTLPYQRTWHPDYDALGGVPAIEEVQFSIAHTRGCFGSCSFCAITFLQGRIVTTRSHESVVNEAKTITQMPNFKGYIHDVGGPTANFRRAACDKQLKVGTARGGSVCSQALPEYGRRSHGLHQPAARNPRALPKVKKVFVRSGLRYDYIMADHSDCISARAVPIPRQRPAQGRGRSTSARRFSPSWANRGATCTTHSVKNTGASIRSWARNSILCPI